MNKYTYSQIQKNKRHTISILVSITIASALLFSICIFLYSFWQSKINSTIESTGYWHGELYDYIAGDKLKSVIYNPEVESTMVKGTWTIGQLTNTKHPYLLMRDGDKNFWKDMNLKNTLIDGRLPQKKGEIVIAKQFFSDNTSYQIGDTFTIPIGERVLGNKVLQAQDYKQENETFLNSGEMTYTIVGILDVSAVSAHPGYIAMGYLDINELKSSDELTVYMRLVHPSKIYEVLPTIAESAGLNKDERGQYCLRYNTSLLGLYSISNKSLVNTEFIVMIIMAITFLLLVMGTFILIIYSTFSLSANSRAKELSILKGLGATPKQIKYSVLYEGFLLWLIQLPIGIIIGYLFSYSIFLNMNEILSLVDSYNIMKFSFSWNVVIISIFISLITVLISAYIPAKKIAKIPLIEGIQQNNSKSIKQREHRLLQKIFGIEGELAGRQFVVNRKSLRTAITSLSICLTLIVSYINIVSIYNLAQSKNSQKTEYDMTVNLNIVDTPDSFMIQRICSLPEVNNSVVYRQVRATTYVTEAQESYEFSSTGGFSEVDNLKYNISKKDDKFKIMVYLVGLSDVSFQRYCDNIGTDFKKYYNNDSQIGILLDSTYHIAKDSKIVQKVPMLHLRPNTNMHLYEKVYDNTSGNYEFDIQVGDVTEKKLGELKTSRYSSTLILPMQKYQQIVSNFTPERELEADRISLDLAVGNDNSSVVKRKIQQICNSYLGSEDFTIWSLLEEKEHEALIQKSISIAVYAVAIMIGMIGIFNTFSTITNNLQLHKREYAMLRSIGLTPSGINKMLLIEGLLFAISPILISTPLNLLICNYMLNITTISWIEFWSVAPVGAIMIYTGCVFISIFLAYLYTSKNIKHGNIIESIQNEII
ncbi:ABC transporter permease [Clostridioides difficile]